MEPLEIRNLDVARRFVVEGFWLQRAVKPDANSVRLTLEWALELAASGRLLPPLGFVSDVGHLALGNDAAHWGSESVHVPGWPATLARQYEDYVLGKLHADWSFERAGDALRRYSSKDRARGLSYLVNQIRERATLSATTSRTSESWLGVHLPPAVLRALLNGNPEDALIQGWDSLMRNGPSPQLLTLYGELVAAFRRIAEVIATEDIVAIEQRTALADMGQYVAHRQVLQVANRIDAGLPTRPVRPYAGRREVPTRVLDEDQYPVGGYTSISTRGTIESLLHSQLAYIEPHPSSDPDLFDLKYARDELFYYSRDENQFLRRRRAFVFVLLPDLIAARVKDPELPCQRIVMIQAAIVSTIRKLSAWLSHDAIRFDVLMVRDGERKPLADEASLLELVLGESIARGVAQVLHIADRSAVSVHLTSLARTHQVQVQYFTTEPVVVETDDVGISQVVVNGPKPQLGGHNGIVAGMDGEEAFEVWQETILRILQLWV